MNPPKPQQNKSVVFQEGQEIFQKGEPGGDIYFIKDGIVEVYVDKDNSRVVLAKMGKGEILGLLTCLSRDPRMASARAEKTVAADKIPFESLQKMMGAMPDWFKTVIKEFIIRINQVNNLYANVIGHLSNMKETQITPLYTGTQVAGCLSVLAPYLEQNISEKKVVVIDDIVPLIENALSCKREDIDEIVAILMEAGLMKIEIEPDRKRMVCPAEMLKNLSWFTQFVQQSRHGERRKLVRARLPHRAKMMLFALSKYARSKGLKASEFVRVDVNDLKQNLENKTGAKFEEEDVALPASLGLIKPEGQGKDVKIAFCPATLTRTLSTITAIQKLEDLGAQKASDKKAA